MNKLSFKYRFYILAGLVLLSVVLIFRLLLLPTIEKSETNHSLKNSIERATNDSLLIKTIEHDLSIVSRLLNAVEAESSQVGIALLNFTNAQVKDKSGTQITEIPEFHEYTFDNIRIYTTRFVVEGMFSDLLMLTHAFENQFEKSNLSSVEFEKITNRQTKQSKLYATFYFQNIEQLQ